MAVSKQQEVVAVQPDSGPRRRRISTRDALIVACSVALGALGWAYLMAANYQPVSAYPGPAAGVWPVTHLGPGWDVTEGGQETMLPVTFDSPRPGTSFVVGQTLIVNGALPIRVTNVSSGFKLGANVKVLYKVADQRPVFRNDSQFIPLKPFSVPGHGKTSPMFGVQFTVPTCANSARHYPAGTSIQTIDMKVTYKVLWFTHTVDIPTLAPATIVNPSDCGMSAR